MDFQLLVPSVVVVVTVLPCCLFPAAATTAAVGLQGAGVHPTTALLMVGVLLSGYSAYLSYTYLLKVRCSKLVLRIKLFIQSYSSHCRGKQPLLR